MSNGLMADPIRPGENNTNNNGYASRQSSSGPIVAIILVVVVMMYILPLIAGIAFIKLVRDELGDFSFDSGAYGSEVDYQLGKDEQQRIARIWSIVSSNATAPTIAQGDCQALKNAVTSYANFNMEPSVWYNSSYCKAGEKVGIEAGYTDDDGDEASSAFVLRLQNVEETVQSCIEITIGGSFQEILNVAEASSCNSRVFTIDGELNDYAIPEVSPQFDESSSPAEESPVIQEG